MIRVKKRKHVCRCHNCGYNVPISPDTVKEKTFEVNTTEKLLGEEITHPIAIMATYVECPVCGERLLKQLDNELTYEKAKQGAKLELLQRRGKKLSDKQKQRLKSINSVLSNTRGKLNKAYWDETYQSLNQWEFDKTEMADQEPTLGDEVTSTENAGERMAENVGI